jgi:hypothetical protein
MSFRFPHIFSCLAGLILLTVSIQAQPIVHEGQMLVAMRTIGHHFLLSIGDSSSRVLPIEKRGQQYLIGFDTEFSFYPETLSASVDSIIKADDLFSHYLVEVEQCQTEKVIYSYERHIMPEQGATLACNGRGQPVNCYQIALTPLEQTYTDKHVAGNRTDSAFTFSRGLLIIPLCILIGLLFFLQKNCPQLPRKIHWHLLENFNLIQKICISYWAMK